MNWKFINKIDKTTNFAEMFIYDEISDEKVNGANFAHEMRYLRMYENVSGIKIKINSVGGNVMHAKSIISEIIDAQEAGVIVETHCNGLAASSAAVIWACAKPENRYIKDYGRVMYHGVSIPDENQLSENDLAAMTNFQATLVQILSNRTGKKEKFFEELFTNGKDNWFDVKMLCKNGLLNKENIICTDIKVEISPEETTAGVVVVYNKLTAKIENNINQNELKMKKVIALLKLQDGAAEEQVESAVGTLQNSLKTTQEAVSAKDAKIAELENKLTEQAATVTAANKAAAVAVVKNAIGAGQIAPEKEAEALVQAENNLEAFKNTLAFIPVKANNILNQINPGQEGNAGDNPLGDDKRTYRQLEKEAPQVLNALRKSNIDVFVNLYNAEYNTNKTAADFKN